VRRSVILGGTGFVGLNLASCLAERAATGDEIVLVDNLSRGRHDDEVTALLRQYPQVKFVKLDLTQPDAYTSIEGAFDHVYLLASMLGVHRVETQPDTVLKTNTLIILGALEWMAKSGSRRLFFSSTSENYAGGYDHGIIPIPTPEQVPLVIGDITNPRFSYAVTKIWGEAASIAFAKRHGFQAVIGRYHNVYGPRMGFDHVIPQVTERILRGENPLRVMGAEQTRAFCHVKDAVEATRLLMEACRETSLIVHIGNDREETRISDLAARLLKLAGRTVEIVPVPAPRGSVPRRLPSVNLLRQATGFEPNVTFEEGLKDTFEWYRRVLAG